MDFQISVRGLHEDAAVVHKELLEFVDKLKELGVSVESAFFSSGHLLGGSVETSGEHQTHFVGGEPVPHRVAPKEEVAPAEGDNAVS